VRDGLTRTRTTSHLHRSQENTVKKLLVLGAGTAGTMIANKLRPLLDEHEWNITLVDQDETHYYQPGFLFVPFGGYSRADLEKPKRRFMPRGVELVLAEIDVVKPDDNTVVLTDGRSLEYDQLIIATGTHIAPEETPGLGSGEPGWYESVFDFYTIDGAEALREKLETWEGGKMVVHINEMPIKCPVAPLEFTFLADAFFAERGIRDQVDITYVTPLPGAFTKPVASRYLGSALDDRHVALEADFFTEQIDGEAKKLISYDEREVDYDLLVTIPVNMGAEFIGRSGLGDELRHVPVDNHNFLSNRYDNIFALGDASNIPASKAGSVAHFAVDIFTENFLDHIAGRPMRAEFDGHANCFIESGHGKGMLIDFNYDTEPLPGKYPLPGIGPFSLLEETEANHWGKLMFKWIYWNVLLTGKNMPIPALMSMAGKIREDLR
jgi:sulfide:quinone oxidoreductase